MTLDDTGVPNGPPDLIIPNDHDCVVVLRARDSLGAHWIRSMLAHGVAETEPKKPFWCAAACWVRPEGVDGLLHGPENQRWCYDNVYAFGCCGADHWNAHIQIITPVWVRKDMK